MSLAKVTDKFVGRDFVKMHLCAALEFSDSSILNLWLHDLEVKCLLCLEALNKSTELGNVISNSHFEA